MSGRTNMLKTYRWMLSTTVAAGLFATAALAEPVTIEVASWKGNETEPAGLPELIEKFEAENPDIKIELTYLSRSDIDVVLPPRLQGDNPPDVMMTDMPLVQVWGAAGLLEDLGRNSPWYEKVLPSLKDGITSGDAAYMLPLEVIGMGNFVNMGLLKSVGIDKPPHTIAELKDACTKLDEAGINPMIFAGGFSGSLFVVANGINRSEIDTAAYGSGEATFEGDTAFSATLDTARELIDAKCFDPAEQAGIDPWSTGLAQFKGGNFAMMPQGAWNIASFRQNEDLDFVFAPIPSDSETGIALDLFGIGWSMSSQTEHKEAARKFIDFFADDENLKIMLTAESAYSPFVGGSSGMATLAETYDTARENGGVVMYPIALLTWPKPVEPEIFDSMTGFLLDPSKENDSILQRWDEVVEDSQ